MGIPGKSEDDRLRLFQLGSPGNCQYCRTGCGIRTNSSVDLRVVEGTEIIVKERVVDGSGCAVRKGHLSFLVRH